MAILKPSSTTGRKQLLNEDNFMYNLANYPSLADAIVAIGGEEATLYIPKGRWYANAVTIPQNITLHFDRGALLTGDCIVNSFILAGGWQIFDGIVTGSIQNTTIDASWFGLVGDGESDDSDALNNAFTAAADKNVYIPEGRFAYTKDLDIKSSVVCDGVLIRNVDITTFYKEFSLNAFLYTYEPLSAQPVVRITRTQESVTLEPDAFCSMSEGTTLLPTILGRKLGTSETTQLFEGGDIALYSTDYMSSRNNNKGDEFYDKSEISSIIGATGQIHPELMFAYAPLPSGVSAWDNGTDYDKGDYVTFDGGVYIATYPSGPSATYTHPRFGEASIGAAEPYGNTTRALITYPDGPTDSIVCWRRVYTTVYYYPPEKPITIKGLKIEVYEINGDSSKKRVNTGVMTLSRSGVELINCSISTKSTTLMISTLLTVSNATHITARRCRFSGATYHGLGYNIVSSATANLLFDHCESVNCRDGLAGRMNKNVTIVGGKFDRIDDHYGRNYLIQGADITGRTTAVPGYGTPYADLEGAYFTKYAAIVFSGSQIRITDCRFSECTTILLGRPDVPNLYGNVSIIDCDVNSPPLVSVINGPYAAPSFDFVYPQRLASNLVIRDVKGIDTVLTKILNDLSGVTTVDSDI